MEDVNTRTAAKLDELSKQKVYFVDYMGALVAGFDRTGFGLAPTFSTFTEKPQIEADFAAIQKRFPDLDWEMLTMAQLQKQFPAGSKPLIVVGSLGKGAFKVIKSRYPEAKVLQWY
ncbi:hypothetical protein [Lacticaseibacillus zhaodongensis]|uniref:hypothetical protein n=1 Tax=Lacticaseibacillus zhaodongensis TaxID=2668065 RepID=UPI0012D34C25|nr:hypothetical protein [Lacticaseibacillus zhaodongensis]